LTTQSKIFFPKIAFDSYPLTKQRDLISSGVRDFYDIAQDAAKEHNRPWPADYLHLTPIEKNEISIPLGSPSRRRYQSFSMTGMTSSGDIFLGCADSTSDTTSVDAFAAELVSMAPELRRGACVHVAIEPSCNVLNVLAIVRSVQSLSSHLTSGTLMPVFVFPDLLCRHILECPSVNNRLDIREQDSSHDALITYSIYAVLAKICQVKQIFLGLSDHRVDGGWNKTYNAVKRLVQLIHVVDVEAFPQALDSTQAECSSLLGAQRVEDEALSIMSTIKTRFAESAPDIIFDSKLTRD